MVDHDRDSRFDLMTVGLEDVLTFWFGPKGATPLANSTKWYKKDPAFDREVKEQFGDVHTLAARGGLDTWKKRADALTSARGRLALIILLDQLSRNIFRDTPRAFAQDARASELALEAISPGTTAGSESDEEKLLTTVERTFLYMPLMHAEDVAVQKKSLEVFERLTKGAPEDLQKYVENSLDYAKKHADIVIRFGRFPHRNQILGRTSTPEEMEFLSQPGSSF